MCELENKNKILKAAFLVSSAGSLSKVFFNGAVIESNGVNSCYNTGHFLYLTTNSPAWIAEIHRNAPASTTVSRAQLPISVKQENE